MGKKSRLKKERKEQMGEVEERSGKGRVTSIAAREETSIELVLLWALRFGVYFVLMTPIFVGKYMFFPFVGLKSIYFMGMVEIIFFIWLYLAAIAPRFRPKWSNLILIALLSFFIVIIVSSIFGIDPFNSFWSKYERMTGVLMWMHLVAFFLVISSVFRDKKEWQRVFTVSTFVAFFIGTGALLGAIGLRGFKILADRGGFTLGNSSFLGTYLLFNGFLAVYLFFTYKSKEEVFQASWKTFFAAVAIIVLLASYKVSARAATISYLGGLVLLGMMYLAFQPKKRIWRVTGKIVLAASLLSIVVASIMLFYPQTFIHKEFAKLATKARFTVWGVAFESFKEKPILGWGPENFDILFTKHFNPKIFLPGYGGEVWFDRAHNIIFDTLVTTGVVGLACYIFIFLAVIFVLWRGYRKKEIDFFTMAVPISLLTGYFVQNMTVFDMVSSYMMFILVLGFAAGVSSGLQEENKNRIQVEQVRPFLAFFLVLIFSLSFFVFIARPFEKDRMIIQALSTVPNKKDVDKFAKDPIELTSFWNKNSSDRLSYYKKALDESPCGQYQTRYYLAITSENLIWQNLSRNLPEKPVKEELDFITNELEKTKKQSPYRFKSILELGKIYSLYSLIDNSKSDKAYKTLEDAIAASPTNPQGYWALVQLNLYEAQKFKSEGNQDLFNKKIDAAIATAKDAISLEPRIFKSQLILLRTLKFGGRKEAFTKALKKALAINSNWKSKFKAEGIID